MSLPSQVYVEQSRGSFATPPRKKARRWVLPFAWVAATLFAAALIFIVVDNARARGMAPHFECPLGC